MDNKDAKYIPQSEAEVRASVNTDLLLRQIIRIIQAKETYYHWHT